MRDASEQAASPASDAQETASHTPVVERLTVEADTGTTGPIVVPHESDGKKRRGIRFGWDNLTYTTRVTAAFAFIAAMTALVAIGVLSFVWEQHFQTYTQANIYKLAESTAGHRDGCGLCGKAERRGRQDLRQPNRQRRVRFHDSAQRKRK